MTHSVGYALMMRLALFIVLVVLIAACERAPSSAPSAAPAPPSPALIKQFERLSEEAQAAMANKRDLTPMLAEVQAMINRSPDFWPARRLRVLLLMQQQRFDEAYEEALKVIELEPGEAEMLSIAGFLATEAADHPAAQGHFRQAVAAAPDNPRFRLQLAQALLATDEATAAQRQAETAIQLDSSQPRAYAMLATIHTRQGRPAEAVEPVRRAIDLTPADAEDELVIYVRQYAALLRELGEPDKALGALRTLPFERQFDPRVMADLAECWSLLGQPDKAAVHYERALTLAPTVKGAAMLAAQWYERAGMPEDARRMWAAARQIGGDR